MFLRPTKHQPLKRRSQLENLPLLVLRCLALLMLAAMFGRPFLRGADTELAEGQMRTVLLLDGSASMRRSGVWEAARTEAREVIEEMAGDGDLAILVVDNEVRTVVGFDDWSSTELGQRKEAALDVVAGLEPGWGGSDLGVGLIAAAELLADGSQEDAARSKSRIVVVSDLQSGAALEAVAEAAWPSDLTVELRPMEAEAVTNASLALAPSVDPDRPIIRVRNDSASEGKRFELVVGEKTLVAEVPAGASRTIQLEEPVAEVVLKGDEHGFDNRLYLAPREPASVTLQFIGAEGSEDSSGPEYYFRNAFGLSEVLRPEYVDDLSEEPAILAISRPLEGEESAEVRRQLEEGGQVLLVVTSREMAGTLGTLAGLPDTPRLTESEGEYVLLEDIDFSHPALREFKDPRWRDFTGVHFWRHRVLQPDAVPGGRVVARFDNGDVAWMEVPVGRGTLLIMFSGWHPRDSQLALSSKFVPLLFSVFAGRGPSVGGQGQFFVHDLLPLEEDEREVQLPAGEVVRLEAGEVFRPAEPGVYRVGDGERSRAFAVNLRPSESELLPLTTTALAAMGVPVAKAGSALETVGGEGGTRRLRDVEAEASQHLWRWAVLILLTLLAIESWVAARKGGSNLIAERTPA
jgi:hypothetical protein